MMFAWIIPAAFVLVGLAGGGALAFFAIRSRDRVKLIEAAPLCAADQLITGLAKMRGEVVALDEEDLLTSPMSKTVCVYYRFLVQEQRSRTVTSSQGGRHVRRTENYWHTIVDDVQAVPTAVQDKTGEALVDLKEAELTLRAMRATSGLFNSLSADMERMLQKRYGVSGKGLIFNKNMRYTESVVEEGTRVFVVGDCKVRAGGSASFVRGAHPLLVTDRDEEELVGHYRRRFVGFLIGAIVLPLVLCGVAGFVGYMIAKTQRGAHPPKKAQLTRLPGGAASAPR
jgi:hypothetical protein